MPGSSAGNEQSPRANLFRRAWRSLLDILVQDVRAMEVRAWFDGIRIDEVGADYLEAFQSHPQEMMEKGNKIYSLTGSNWQGFIVGGIISTLEDEGDYMAPSGLLSKPSEQQRQSEKRRQRPPVKP